MSTQPQARGELQVRGGDRQGERIADTVGHRAGSARRTGQALPRFYPLGWSRAITCRGGLQVRCLRRNPRALEARGSIASDLSLALVYSAAKCVVR